MVLIRRVLHCRRPLFMLIIAIVAYMYGKLNLHKYSSQLISFKSTCGKMNNKTDVPENKFTLLWKAPDMGNRKFTDAGLDFLNRNLSGQIKCYAVKPCPDIKINRKMKMKSKTLQKKFKRRSEMNEDGTKQFFEKCFYLGYKVTKLILLDLAFELMFDVCCLTLLEAFYPRTAW